MVCFGVVWCGVVWKASVVLVYDKNNPPQPHAGYWRVMTVSLAVSAILYPARLKADN